MDITNFYYIFLIPNSGFLGFRRFKYLEGIVLVSLSSAKKNIKSGIDKIHIFVYTAYIQCFELHITAR